MISEHSNGATGNIECIKLEMVDSEYINKEVGKCIEEPHEENYDLPLEDRIINHLAKSNVILKTQQKNDPDFTYDERKQISKELLDKSPSQFLYRFGKHLNREHLQYFDNFPGDVETEFYLRETQKVLNKTTRRLIIRNRRYGALQKMESSSSYFSEEEMRKRDPLLYDQLVDRNLTDEERQERVKSNRSPINSFSDLLLQQIDKSVTNARKRHQEELEEDAYEEFDDEDDEEEYDSDDDNKIVRMTIDQREKEIMQNEFHTSLCSQFLSGKDDGFDYSKIDESEEYDLLDYQIQDEEERYFDEEESAIIADDSSITAKECAISVEESVNTAEESVITAGEPDSTSTKNNEDQNMEVDGAIN